MIDYIKGTITEILPTEMTLECHGIGYKILISLQSFEVLKTRGEAMVYIHHYLREDDEQYFGFASKDERELFRLLIGVSGVGAATARMMLSSMSSDELRNAILSEDINRIKSIKGIGLKSAQRLILELKDKSYTHTNRLAADGSFLHSRIVRPVVRLNRRLRKTSLDHPHCWAMSAIGYPGLRRSEKARSRRWRLISSRIEDPVT